MLEQRHFSNQKYTLSLIWQVVQLLIVARDNDNTPSDVKEAVEKSIVSQTASSKSFFLAPVLVDSQSPELCELSWNIGFVWSASMFVQLVYM